MYLMDVGKPSNSKFSVLFTMITMHRSLITIYYPDKLLEGADEAHIPFDLPELSYETVKLPSGYGEWGSVRFISLGL